MAVRRVSQKNIAEVAGVHVTTVSLALRNSKSLLPETREKIQRIARELGYQPDPMLSALTVYRKKVQMPYFQGTIAWLDNLKKSGAKPSSKVFPEYWAGARERCEELGYHIEEFSSSDMSLTRISNILKARGISCILLPPQPRQVAHMRMDWENYCALSFGFSLTHPRLHLVTNAQYRAARLAVRTVRRYGYRRIGLVTLDEIEVRTDHNFSSGYLAEHRLGGRKPLPIFEYSYGKTASRRSYAKEFAKWFRNNQPDAIIYLDNDVPDALRALGVGPDMCGHASLAAPTEGGEVAGVHQNGKLVGRTAVDYLVDMYNRNERGVPKTPFRLLVEGYWVDGASLPRRVLPRQAVTAD